MEERYSTEPPGVGWTYQGNGRWSRSVEEDGLKDGARVAVVGGGASGLFTAYLINQHMPDVAVTVFEATERVGGKILTDEFDNGTPFEAGVAELYDYSDTEDPLRMLVEDDLGLATADMTGGAIVFKDEVFSSLDELEQAYVVTDQGQDARKRVDTLYRKATSIGKPQYWIPEGDEFVQPYHVVGGLGRIPAALLEKIDAEVKTSTRVIRILKKDKGYVVSTLKTKGSDIIEDTEYFDAVVVALPAQWLRTVEWDDDLDTSVREIGDKLDLSAHYLRVSVLFDKKWWKSLKIPGEVWMMDVFNGCLCYDESSRWGLDDKEDEDSSEQGHVLSFLLTGTDALLLCSANQDDGCVIERVLESLPASMREDAQEHYVDAKVHRYLGGITGGDDWVKKHVPEPSGYPGVFLTNTHLYGSTLNSALTAADEVVEMLGDYLGGKGVG